MLLKLGGHLVDGEVELADLVLRAVVLDAHGRVGPGGDLLGGGGESAQGSDDHPVESRDQTQGDEHDQEDADEQALRTKQRELLIEGSEREFDLRDGRRLIQDEHGSDHPEGMAALAVFFDGDGFARRENGGEFAQGGDRLGILRIGRLIDLIGLGAGDDHVLAVHQAQVKHVGKLADLADQVLELGAVVEVGLGDDAQVDGLGAEQELALELHEGFLALVPDDQGDDAHDHDRLDGQDQEDQLDAQVAEEGLEEDGHQGHDANPVARGRVGGRGWQEDVDLDRGRRHQRPNHFA
ncbi:hypothetical protein D3C87_928930 [compost metagenome]